MPAWAIILIIVGIIALIAIICAIVLALVVGLFIYFNKSRTPIEQTYDISYLIL